MTHAHQNLRLPLLINMSNTEHYNKTLANEFCDQKVKVAMTLRERYLFYLLHC